MGVEFVALGVSYLVALLAFGTFLWRAIVRLIDQMSELMAHRFGTLDRKIDDRFETLDGKIDDRFETLDRKIDDRFETLDRKIDERNRLIEAKVDKVEAKVDELARDHQSLARQLAEFRGEVRGHLGQPPPPDPAPA